MEKPVLEEKVEVVEEVKKPKKTTKKESIEAPIDITELEWLPAFKLNYEGKSEEAKELEPFLKENYKGNAYIPWATMERLVYMTDPRAKFTNLVNAEGGLVHTDVIENGNYNMQKGEVISSTKASIFSHFVRVALEWKGKVMIEDFPIQDQDYSAAKVYNQNLVNKALQRAKAKVGARCTGLGLKLYEGFDLQFDEKIKEEVKPTLPVTEVKVVEKTKKEVEKIVAEKVMEGSIDESEVKEVAKVVEKEVTEKVTEKVTEPVVEVVENIKVEMSDEIERVIDIIKGDNTESVTRALQQVNVSVLKKYNFVISPNDTNEDLVYKLSQFPNVEKFGNTLENLMGS